MTTVNEARDAVYERFIAQFPGLAPGIPYTFENEAFDPQTDTPWVRVTVRNAESQQRCLGSPGHRRFERNAFLFAQVFVPGDTGTKESDALVTALRGIFEAVSFGGLDFRAVSSRETGTDNGWHQTLVEGPFDFEETK